MKLTQEMIDQLSGYSERFQIVTLKQWRLRGYDIGEHGKLLDGPSLARRVANLGKALVSHAKNGCRLVPQEEQERRLAICQGCEFFGLKKAGVCGHKDCGCTMRTKVKLASSFCPDKPRRWDKWTCESECVTDSSASPEGTAQPGKEPH